MNLVESAEASSISAEYLGRSTTTGQESQCYTFSMLHVLMSASADGREVVDGALV